MGVKYEQALIAFQREQIYIGLFYVLGLCIRLYLGKKEFHANKTNNNNKILLYLNNQKTTANLWKWEEAW